MLDSRLEVLSVKDPFVMTLFQFLILCLKTLCSLVVFAEQVFQSMGEHVEIVAHMCFVEPSSNHILRKSLHQPSPDSPLVRDMLRNEVGTIRPRHVGQNDSREWFRTKRPDSHLRNAGPPTLSV